MNAAAMTAAILAAASLPAQAAPLMRAAGGKPAREDYVRAWGVRPEDWPRAFGSDGALAVEQVASSVPCNIARPGEDIVATIQVRNLSPSPLQLRGRWLFVSDTLRTRGADVFDLELVGSDPLSCGDIALDLVSGTAARAEVAVPLPETFGAGALLFERADTGTRLFAAHFARCIDPDNPPGQRFHQICMDNADPALVARLQTAPNRVGVQFVPPDDPGCEAYYAGVAKQLRALGATGYPVIVEFGAGPSHGAYLPLGRTRPHLSPEDVLLETKSDFAWLPSYDAAFRERVRALVAEFGWPKGPVNAVKLWNEPWNGLSISGWGADDLRYREIFAALFEGTDAALAADPSLRVLKGGCDSSSNTFDKLFPDGDLRFLPHLDFLSLHYQGLAPSNPRLLRERQGPNGRTLFWDTESWVANSPDRVPCVLAGMIAAGHDRLVGIQGEAVVATAHDVVLDTADGRQTVRLAQAWPVAPALCAFQRFVGNRRFDGLVWEGLPWIWRFQGDAPDDLTLVVCGDISPVFDGKGRSGLVPFWTAQVPDPGIQIVTTLSLSGVPGASLHDGNGNIVAQADADGRLTVPLSDAGLYLRPGTEPGSAARLLAAVDAADIRGVPAIAPALVDATAPIDAGAVFHARLRNLLNRPFSGNLLVKADGLSLDYNRAVVIPPHAEVDIPLRVISGKPVPENAYSFHLAFEEEGRLILWQETLHVNFVASGAPEAPDDFESWKTPWPQPVFAGGDGITQMERAWLPMLVHETAPATGAAVAWFRADDRAFYFAAQIADSTPDPGMPRFETRDEDADFYPAVAFELDREATVSCVPATAPGGRSALSSLADKMAFTLDVGADPRTLNLVLADDDGMLRRRYTLTVSDADGDRTETLAPAVDLARIPVAVRGSARVEIRTLNWLKPLVLGVEDADGAPVSVTWEDRVQKSPLAWPEGVRRFSYRRRPELPQGSTPPHDNVQLAFNVLPDSEKPWLPAAPGTFKGYAASWDTDWEFALNPVAESFGGGTEVWTLRAPGLPDKHFYPRSPKAPGEGPVKGASLRCWRDDTHRYVVCSLPWSAFPELAQARAAGRPVKISFRVNDNAAPGACMELARRRSVSKRNNSFKPDWGEHWANELAFGWEPSPETLSRNPQAQESNTP